MPRGVRRSGARRGARHRAENHLTLSLSGHAESAVQKCQIWTPNKQVMPRGVWRGGARRGSWRRAENHLRPRPGTLHTAAPLECEDAVLATPLLTLQEGLL